MADGGALLAPSITRRLIGQFAERLAVDSALSVRIERLTEREREVVSVVRMLETCKLGLRDRAQIVVFAYESGLVQAGDLDIGH